MRALISIGRKADHIHPELETEDYIRIFSVIHRARNVNLRNAGQFKDEVIEYIIERHIPIRNLQLEAANLVSNEGWINLFSNWNRSS